MDGALGKKYLKDYSAEVQPILAEFLSAEMEVSKDLGKIPLMLMDSYKDMISRGKGIRGTLVKLGYLVGGGKDVDEVVRTSIFVELFHSAILIHDDFMDRDPFRRGAPTVHEEFKKVGKDFGVRIPLDHYGNTAAVCLGDAGLYLSWKALLNSKLPQDRVIEASKLYADFIVRLALGQSLDMTITGMEDIGEQDILTVIWTKSGEYTSQLPLFVGATLAGGMGDEKLAALKDYAKCFGWAFQIQDDILGLYADEDELGKPVGSDIREGKNTLLMLNLRKHGRSADKKFMRKVLGNPNVSVEDVEKMRKILKESGAFQKVVDMGWEYVEEGKQYISRITKDKKLLEVLESLLVYMMERTK
jgi:geranylgeranyl diphosphate synthase type I